MERGEIHDLSSAQIWREKCHVFTTICTLRTTPENTIFFLAPFLRTTTHIAQWVILSTTVRFRRFKFTFNNTINLDHSSTLKKLNLWLSTLKSNALRIWQILTRLGDLVLYLKHLEKGSRKYQSRTPDLIVTIQTRVKYSLIKSHFDTINSSHPCWWTSTLILKLINRISKLTLWKVLVIAKSDELLYSYINKLTPWLMEPGGTMQLYLMLI